MLVSIVYVALYVLADWLSDVRPGLKLGITPWNPQAGITVALLVLFGPRWVLLPAITTVLAQSVIRHVPINSVATLAALWVAFAYSLTAGLMRRWNLTEPVRASRAAALFAFATVIGTLLASTGYLGAFLFSGVSISDALLGFVRYWVGDLNGVLVLAPLAIHVSQWREPLRVVSVNRWELAAQVGVMGLMLWLIFMLPSPAQLRFFYLLFVPVIWICLRWSVPGAMLSVLAIQSGLVIAAYLNIPTPRFLDIQVLMLTLSLTALLLGAVVAERTGREAEQRRAEERLRERDAALARAMRFAVAGELASALAHELNQPITALVSYLRASEILASRPAEEEERLHDTLRKAAQEAMRASVVLRRLRDFYRGGRGNRESIDVGALCEAVARSFHERLRRADASLTVAVAAALPKLEADPTQLEIVLHNLLSNGLDSLSEAAPQSRKLQLSATCREKVVELCVEDSGPGIGHDVVGKLFEPFVTSKPDGMGLGLAISRTLLLTRGGELICSRSERLGGAAFTVRVPLDIPQETALV